MGMGHSLLQTQQRLTRQLTPLLRERSGDIDDDELGDGYDGTCIVGRCQLLDRL